MTSPQTPHFDLDEYLNGIRQNFKRLNEELDKARNQRDEYKTNYTNLAKELQELQETVAGTRKGHNVVCEHCHSSRTTDDLSPTSSESYFSMDEEDASPSLQSAVPSNPDASYNVGYNVEYIHDTNALELNLVHTSTQSAAPTLSASLSMDGKYLATISELGMVQMFDVKSGKSLCTMRDLYESEDNDSDVPRYWCLGFSADGKFLATGQVNGHVKIWIVSQRRVRNVFKHEHAVLCLDFSPNGQCIAISSEADVIIWRLRDGFSRVFEQSGGNSSWGVRFSKDGRYIAAGGNCWIRIWNVRTGECIASRLVDGDAVEFTHDGKALFTGSRNNVIHWDVSLLKSTQEDNTDGEDISRKDFAEISRFVGHTDPIYSISISPDGHWIASGSFDNTVRIWNAHTATLQCILRGHIPVIFVGFCHIGHCLVVVDGEGQSTVWDYRNLQCT